MKSVFTGLLVLCLLSACGGGGGGSNRVPEIVPPSRVVTLTEDTTGPTAEKVLQYLQIDASGGPWGEDPYSHSGHLGNARYAEAPTMRIARGTPAHTRALVHHAVAVINRELPHQWHIQIGDDAPSLALMEDIPVNQIFFDLTPASNWIGGTHQSRPDIPAIAIQEGDGLLEYDHELERFRRRGKTRAHIWMSSEYDFGSDARFVSVLMHEIVHALGFNLHVESDEFPNSIVGSRAWDSTRIPAIDGAALRVLYTRLPTSIEPEELSIASLGPWESTETNLTGTLDSVSFGVSHRQGVSVPWTNGTVPDTALADNTSLMGTATWNGGLLGFTLAEQPVSGDAEINVNLDTLTGRADFTELESWATGMVPGNTGTGTTWGDGDLGYTLSISGNYLQSTGGDDGVITGNFYGNNHEGVAGSLEREDLSAAFGALR